MHVCRAELLHVPKVSGVQGNCQTSAAPTTHANSATPELPGHASSLLVQGCKRRKAWDPSKKAARCSYIHFQNSSCRCPQAEWGQHHQCLHSWLRPGRYRTGLETSANWKAAVIKDKCSNTIPRVTAITFLFVNSFLLEFVNSFLQLKSQTIACTNLSNLFRT